jgi:hypothetical protein
VEGEALTLTGRTLERAGLFVQDLHGDFRSQLIHIVAADGE